MASGRWIMVPRGVTTPTSRRSRIINRRRRTLFRLLGFAGVTLALGFVPSLHWVWLINLVADTGVAAYVVRLRRWKLEESGRRLGTNVVAGQEGLAERALRLDEQAGSADDRFGAPEEYADPDYDAMLAQYMQSRLEAESVTLEQPAIGKTG
jgi:hypothetical protein